MQEIKDVRDEILAYLKKEERPLTWLSKKTDIPHGTIYGCFIHRTYKLSDENLAKINAGLGTDFKVEKD